MKVKAILFFLLLSTALFANPFSGQIGLVIIDAGHGGNDPGAVGFGIYEKDVTLELALALKAELEKNDIPCVLTRESDVYLSLEERVSFARSQSYKAGTYPIFISLHCNSSDGESAAGTEIYIKKQSSTPNFYYKDLANVTLLSYSSYSKIQLNRYLNIRNYNLADTVSKEFQSAFPLKKSRGVKETDYYVLINNPITAILIEVGFLSNKEENALITSPLFQVEAAEAIRKAIL